MDRKDGCGYTPLHLAAMHDEEGAMKVLIEAGVSLGVDVIVPRTYTMGSVTCSNQARRRHRGESTRLQ